MGTACLCACSENTAGFCTSCTLSSAWSEPAHTTSQQLNADTPEPAYCPASIAQHPQGSRPVRVQIRPTGAARAHASSRSRPRHAVKWPCAGSLGSEGRRWAEPVGQRHQTIGPVDSTTCRAKATTGAVKKASPHRADNADEILTPSHSSATPQMLLCTAWCIGILRTKLISVRLRVVRRRPWPRAQQTGRYRWPCTTPRPCAAPRRPRRARGGRAWSRVRPSLPSPRGGRRA